MYITCCKILGVKPGSDAVTLKQAYRKKAKLYHPDLNPLPEASIEFIKIKRAFDYLICYSHITNISSERIVSRYNQYQNYSFRREQFKHHQERNLINKKTKTELDFKKTLFGKSVYYFFHFLFLFTGIFITAGPIFSLITYGFDPEKSMATTLILVSFASLFGLIMTVVVVLSGFGSKFPFRLVN